jgi:hypothetical protein
MPPEKKSQFRGFRSGPAWIRTRDQRVGEAFYLQLEPEKQRVFQAEVNRVFSEESVPWPHLSWSVRLRCPLPSAFMT